MRVWQVAFLFILIVCVGCTHSKKNTLKIAASPVPHAEILELIREDLLEAGVHLQIIEIDDYQLPNQLLADKEVDANFFQHEPFMRLQEKGLNAKFAVLVATHVEPMGLYSCKWGDVEDLPKGGQIALPCDPSNESRALELLGQSGLISLKEGNKGCFSILDIFNNPYGFRFQEMDSALLPRILKDVDGAIIPANYALQSGLSLSEALLKEDLTSTFVNIVVIREEDMQNENLLLLKKFLTSEKVKEFISERYNNNLSCF